SDAIASHLCFDKHLTKQRCIAAAILTPRFALVESPMADWPEGWEPPVVLKPLRQGSSVGLQFVNHVTEWRRALGECFRYDTRVLLEEKITGREATVGILAGKALPVVEVR